MSKSKGRRIRLMRCVVMLTFDDFLIGLDTFGKKIQPLMKSRKHITAPANGSNGEESGTNGAKRQRVE